MKTAPATAPISPAPLDAERASNRAFFENADKPTPHGLSYALRHPELWPAGFEWNYDRCNQCAMGLAQCLRQSILPGSNDTSIGASRMAHAFAMSYTDASNIFFGSRTWVPIRSETRGHLWWKECWNVMDRSRVTPDMVADQIDAYLARAE